MLFACRQRVNGRRYNVQEPELDYGVESDEDWEEPADGELLTVCSAMPCLSSCSFHALVTCLDIHSSNAVAVVVKMLTWSLLTALRCLTFGVHHHQDCNGL